MSTHKGGFSYTQSERYRQLSGSIADLVKFCVFTLIVSCTCAVPIKQHVHSTPGLWHRCVVCRKQKDVVGTSWLLSAVCTSKMRQLTINFVMCLSSLYLDMSNRWTSPMVWYIAPSAWCAVCGNCTSRGFQGAFEDMLTWQQWDKSKSVCVWDAK